MDGQIGRDPSYVPGVYQFHSSSDITATVVKSFYACICCILIPKSPHKGHGNKCPYRFIVVEPMYIFA